MRCVIFAYDFPHWKSWLGIQEIALAGFSDLLVLAAPWVPLPSRPQSLVVGPRKIPSGHPSDVSRSVGIDYVSTPHAGAECEQLLSGYHADVGIILGARILPKATLRAADCAIVNVHPGILPDNRGLDTVAWAVARDWPQGVAAHVITIGQVDAGPLLGMYALGQLEADDSLVEISARLDSLQLILLFQVAHFLAPADHVPSGATSLAAGPYHSYFTESQAYLDARLEEYRQRYSVMANGWAASRAELLRGLDARFAWAEALDKPSGSMTCHK
jgi:hypothetical protein